MSLDDRYPDEPEESIEFDESDRDRSGPDDSDHDQAGSHLAPSEQGLLGPSGTSKELLKAFWSIVLLLNLGILAVSLGLLLIGFRGNWQLGGALLLVGVVALLRGVFSYRRVRTDEDLWEND